MSFSERDIPRKRPFPLTCGVPVPEIIELFLGRRRRASEAAWMRRLVVPSAFVDPDRAEQTIATLCWSIYSLDTPVLNVEVQDQKLTHEKMSSAILTANFPTLVPPYFCTSHLADGSMEFW